ncbi:hypothetical protein B0T22DRAFT_261788 [Podospora appendiculata]|uniref:Uncharacterized protein n=1 Tax=Podospora appendiculata TaxID=314037 RepID=A0AAE0X2W1_9PEZI|nr:hypothetical protein B0T22DRAFT_261788 [Podospora appendiculata]
MWATTTATGGLPTSSILVLLSANTYTPTHTHILRLTLTLTRYAHRTHRHTTRLARPPVGHACLAILRLVMVPIRHNTASVRNSRREKNAYLLRRLAVRPYEQSSPIEREGVENDGRQCLVLFHFLSFRLQLLLFLVIYTTHNFHAREAKATFEPPRETGQIGACRGCLTVLGGVAIPCISARIANCRISVRYELRDKTASFRP